MISIPHRCSILYAWRRRIPFPLMRIILMTDNPRLPRTFSGWLRLFGPGAIIASLTIGTGELIFSTRGGALFGYRILFLFVAISLLKWGLVLGSARHIVLTGVHPYARLFDLPGPRGFLAWTLLLIAAAAVPVWVAFQSAVLGNLISWITGTREHLSGGADYLWGSVVLVSIVALAATRGYATLERVQLVVVTTMVACAGISLILFQPNWSELLLGAVLPRPLVYPPWLARSYPDIAAEPVWIEATRYVGVIGGAAYDYMAYTSFLRDKRWGNAAMGPVTGEALETIAADSDHPVRKWTRAPLVDCTISFLLIVVFSGCFVALGALVLGPNHRVPDEANMLNLQSTFLTRLHPWLLPLYVSGAFLTMLGTLYGTLEVACALTKEMGQAMWASRTAPLAPRTLRRATIAWCCAGAIAILVWLAFDRISGGQGRPRIVLAILTPANLFTGVLGCGLFCLLNLWIDHKYLPRKLRLPWWLWSVNAVSAAVFVLLGVKGYWDLPSRLYAAVALAAFMIAGMGTAAWFQRRVKPAHRNGSDLTDAFRR